MTDQLKRHFVNIMFMVRKMDVCNNLSLSLPLNEMVVLKRLFNNDSSEGSSMCMSDIHHNLYISKPAVSQILNSLEKKGYINRYIDKNDRRKILVTATPAALEVLNSTEAALDSKVTRIISEYGEDNMLHLINQLASLYEILEKIEKEEKKQEKGEYDR